jgi:hypothetical protein
VLGYVEQTDDTQDVNTNRGTAAFDGTGSRKRICIEAWADEAAFRPNVGHYCSLACAVADLERALMTRRYNGTQSNTTTIPYRPHRAEAYANDAA